MKTAEPRYLYADMAVIGGAGFLGRSLIARLGGKEPVRCLDRAAFPSDARRPARFVSMTGSAHDRQALGRLLDGVDTVWIRAGLLGGPQSVDARTCTDYLRENADMVSIVLEACEAAGCARVLYDSSEQVFGQDSDRAPAVPSGEPLSLNFYGASKLIAEKQLRAWSSRVSSSPRSVQIFRYPRIRAAYSRDAIFQMASAALAGKAIRVIGDVDHAIDFADLDDVMAANLSALRRAPTFIVYHISSAPPVTLLQLAVCVQKIVAEITGCEVPIARAPDKNKTSFEPRILGLSSEGSLRELGIAKTKTLDEMIRSSVAWIQENP